MPDENGRNIFHVQPLVKTFCQIPCNGGENAGRGAFSPNQVVGLYEQKGFNSLLIGVG